MFKKQKWKNHFKIRHARNTNNVAMCYVSLDREEIGLLLDISVDSINNIALEILTNYQNDRRSPVSILKKPFLSLPVIEILLSNLITLINVPSFSKLQVPYDRGRALTSVTCECETTRKS